MQFITAFLAVLAGVSTVQAHATVFGVSVNGKDQGDGRSKYIRTPTNNSPVKDLTSPNLACNVKGTTPVPEFVKATAGDTITFEWFHDNRGDDIIDPSHKGPLQTYIAPYTETDVAKPIWTKIQADGFDVSTKKWAVDKLIANKGKIDVVLPATLPAGKYLVRQEIIALHEANVAFADNPARGAQIYMSCVQADIAAGAGPATPLTQNFDFNKGYTKDTPGIVFNAYVGQAYPLPGPAVMGATTTTPAGNATFSNSAASATASGTKRSLRWAARTVQA